MLAKIWQIDIDSELEPLYLDPRYGRLDILVLDGNKPLTVVPIFPRNGQRIISPDQLTEFLAWQHWTDSCASRIAIGNQAPPLPAISVVVCTRDRPLSLENCLRNLQDLDYPEYAKSWWWINVRRLQTRCAKPSFGAVSGTFGRRDRGWTGHATVVLNRLDTTSSPISTTTPTLQEAGSGELRLVLRAPG